MGNILSLIDVALMEIHLESYTPYPEVDMKLTYTYSDDDLEELNKDKSLYFTSITIEIDCSTKEQPESKELFSFLARYFVVIKKMDKNLEDDDAQAAIRDVIIPYVDRDFNDLIQKSGYPPHRIYSMDFMKATLYSDE